MRTLGGMEQTKAPLDLRALVVDAALAGITAGVLLEAYLYATVVAPNHASLLGGWAWIASTVLGKAAFSNPYAPWIGLLFHFLVSIGWAGGYAYLAQQNTVMRDRWVTSGIVYGICVAVGMQLILLADGNFMWNGWPAYGNTILGHALFFGLPLAYIVRALARRRA